MSYLIFKAIHLSAMVCWIGSVATQLLLLQATATSGGQAATDQDSGIGRMASLSSAIALPAMIITIGAGVMMLTQVNWMSATWFKVKAPLVFLLILMTGVLHGSLKRRAMGGDSNGAGAPLGLLIGIPATVLFVILLAVTKFN